ncbi:hypothetical protein H257_05667 [Aphanomyces astaci]|uniref:Uncharacterized protein n=1 Tax=Aphanomyces astaci TaxID=112090 RepID=W4GMY3_APHAT|nr:hypothetical protein H257_05667 [Aphanomyces astaci]ETV81045.1 hypothetical protein H257_05667 [Aphanomyces astaci]|eukprot:XP_009828903.1 hypothetical protein H257_05667 [Aphanomyces astaci]
MKADIDFPWRQTKDLSSEDGPDEAAREPAGRNMPRYDADSPTDKLVRKLARVTHGTPVVNGRQEKRKRQTGFEPVTLRAAI